MRINFHKSELIPLNLDLVRAHEIAHIFSCPLRGFPFKYLGVPTHFERLKREDLQPLLDKLIKMIAGWRGRLLAYSSRLVLIKTCLSSVPVYILSFLKFPKWAIRMIESQMAHNLWNNSDVRHNYHLVNWGQVCMKKEYVGLGCLTLGS
jgi:hypothetical protein